jgi:uncharacterized protein YecT (DUF1311 family)
MRWWPRRQRQTTADALRYAWRMQAEALALLEAERARVAERDAQIRELRKLLLAESMRVTELSSLLAAESARVAELEAALRREQ